jgi:hypothetical protein
MSGGRRVFGVQRPPYDIAGIALLFAGFTMLALGFWVLNANWAGILLPLGFLIGAFNSLRTEVRQIELHDDALIVRTFFRQYSIPRAHVTKVVHAPEGAAVDVLNGRRYVVSPPQADAREVALALEMWLLSSRA